MLVIGLIGGIANGKTFVAECFRNLGAELLNADKMGHEILEQPEVSQHIREWWPDVVDACGKINRQRLAAIVFPASRDSGPNETGNEALDRLESLVHPLISEMIDKRLSELRSQSVPVVVLDAPVLIKAGWHNRCHKIVFVECDRQARQHRIRNRGWDESEIANRERFQSPLETKRQHATQFIDNSGPADATRAQVERLWESWVAETITSDSSLP